MATNFDLFSVPTVWGGFDMDGLSWTSVGLWAPVFWQFLSRDPSGLFEKFLAGHCTHSLLNLHGSGRLHSGWGPVWATALFGSGSWGMCLNRLHCSKCGMVSSPFSPTRSGCSPRNRLLPRGRGGSGVVPAPSAYAERWVGFYPPPPRTSPFPSRPIVVNAVPLRFPSSRPRLRVIRKA
jgi:hypothetical protein